MRPEHLSVSQVTTYLTCPRKYRFRYVDRLEPERVSIDLVFGRAVHSALAWFVEEGASAEHELLARTFRADFQAERMVPRVDYDEKDPAALAALGESLVRAAAPVVRELRPKAAETKVEVELVEPHTGRGLGIPLLGYVDLVLEDGLGEIKTASRKTGPSNYLFQLAAYRYAWRRQHQVVPRFQLVELVKTKAPSVVVLEVNVTDRDERWFLEVASAVLDSLRREAFHPIPNYLCSRCEYRRTCRTT